ncbi:MAG: diguanylate cyclase [Pseudomonadota bacterium]
MPEQRARILVIDDSPEIIRLLTLLLAERADISFATSGVRGIEVARRIQPELVLLDVSLPDIDGFEVCKRLKSYPETANTPILFVTAGDSEDAEVAALEAGAVDFIAKPLRPAIVKARVNTHLALRLQHLLLQEMADLDGLTGIFNRRFFDRQLEKEVARQRRRQAVLSVALLDVDHFKLFNDALGHQAGDDCLKAVAGALNAATRRPGETLARYGGEEFVVILPDATLDDAQKYGEWIRDKVAALAIAHPASPTAGVLTVSMGICTRVPAEGFGPLQFLQSADAALYRAKRGGRNMHVVATE